MGRAILAVRVSDNPDEDVELDEPAVKYVANMHGNEGSTSSIIIY